MHQAECQLPLSGKRRPAPPRPQCLWLAPGAETLQEDHAPCTGSPSTLLVCSTGHDHTPSLCGSRFSCESTSQAHASYNACSRSSHEAGRAWHQAHGTHETLGPAGSLGTLELNVEHQVAHFLPRHVACRARSLTFSPRMPWVGAGQDSVSWAGPDLTKVPALSPDEGPRQKGRLAGREFGGLQVGDQLPSGTLLQPTRPTTHTGGSGILAESPKGNSLPEASLGRPRPHRRGFGCQVLPQHFL